MKRKIKDINISKFLLVVLLLLPILVSVGIVIIPDIIECFKPTISDEDKKHYNDLLKQKIEDFCYVSMTNRCEVSIVPHYVLDGIDYSIEISEISNDSNYNREDVYEFLVNIGNLIFSLNNDIVENGKKGTMNYYVTYTGVNRLNNHYFVFDFSEVVDDYCIYMDGKRTNKEYIYSIETDW